MFHPFACYKEQRRHLFFVINYITHIKMMDMLLVEIYILFAVNHYSGKVVKNVRWLSDKSVVIPWLGHTCCWVRLSFLH